MEKKNHIAVVDDVVFSLRSGFAGIPCAHAAFIGEHVFVGDDFGADEPFLDVGVDFTGGFFRHACLA